jgi:hypothetical protein
MVNIPSVPEIITVNSEELQTLIRDLLPSQSGFGSELQASNVITPIIDLTATAEGSSLSTDLARAIAFGSQTAFNAENSSVVLANAPGFYRILFTATNRGTSATSAFARLTMTDGLSVKTVWEANLRSGAAQTTTTGVTDIIVWLSAGDSITATTTLAGCVLVGSVRQVADSEGKTVNPSGYPL